MINWHIFCSHQIDWKKHSFKDYIRTFWEEAQQEVIPSQTKQGCVDSCETDPVIQINHVGIAEELVKLKYQGLIFPF